MSARAFRSFTADTIAKQQLIAKRNYCLLALETMHPRFRFEHHGHIVILTVNAGYE